MRCASARWSASKTAREDSERRVSAGMFALGDSGRYRFPGVPGVGRLGAAGDEDGEWIARAPGSDRQLDLREARAREKPPELFVVEPEPDVAESFANPGLIVFSELENQNLTAGRRMRTASASAAAGRVA